MGLHYGNRPSKNVPYKDFLASIENAPYVGIMAYLDSNSPGTLDFTTMPNFGVGRLALLASSASTGDWPEITGFSTITQTTYGVRAALSYKVLDGTETAMPWSTLGHGCGILVSIPGDWSTGALNIGMTETETVSGPMPVIPGVSSLFTNPSIIIVSGHIDDDSVEVVIPSPYTHVGSWYAASTGSGVGIGYQLFEDTTPSNIESVTTTGIGNDAGVGFLAQIMLP